MTATTYVGRTEGDEALAAIGVTRLAIPIPFKAAGGPVNVFVIEDEAGLALFDSGLGTPEAEAALFAAFAEAGKRVEDVRRVIVSHGHIDHYGAARTVVEKSGAKVFIHPADAQKVVASARWVDQQDKYAAYFLNLGVPKERIHRMAELAGSTEQFARRLDHVEPLADGDTLRFAKFEAKVLHMPGHTPGLVCLWDEAHGILFADDHLLARVSPNPLLELGPNGEADKFRALATYFASIRDIRSLEAKWILPGHGAPFRDHRALIDSLLAFYEKRQAKMLAALASGPRTPAELVQDLFGAGRTLELYLMLSEVVGNLEVLEDQGRVRRVPGTTPYQFEAVA